MKFAPVIVFTSQNAATINSTPIPAQDLIQASGQITAVGASSAGTFKMQCSNDNPVSGTGQLPTNWSDIPSATIAVSAAGVFLIPKTELCYQWIRFSYTNSGSGTISAMGKLIGF